MAHASSSLKSARAAHGGPRATATARYRDALRSRSSFSQQVWAIMRKCFLARLRDPFPVLVTFGYAMLLLALFWLFARSTVGTDERKSQFNKFPKLADPLETCLGVPKGECVTIGFTNDTNIDPVIVQLERIVKAAEAPHPVTIRYFPSEEAILSFYDNSPRSLVSAVRFDDVKAATTFPYTSPESVVLPQQRPSVSYIIYGNLTARTVDPIAGRFLTAQAYVERALINARRASFELDPLPPPFDTTSPNTVPLLSWINTEDGRSHSLGTVAAFIIIYMAIDLWNSVFVDLTADKNSGIREALTVQGLAPSAYSIGVFIAHMVFNLPTIIAWVIVGVSAKSLFPNTDPTLFAFIMLLYLASLLLFGLLLGATVSNPINGRYLSNTMFFICILLFQIVGLNVWDSTFQVVWGVSGIREVLIYFFSPVVMGRILMVLNRNESLGQRTSWSVLGSTSSGPMPMLILVLVLNVVTYAFLVWWADQVAHGGMPGFFFLRSEYWSGQASVAQEPPATTEAAAATALNSKISVAKMPGYDQVSSEHKQGPAVSLHNVVKTFITLNAKGVRNIEYPFVKNMNLDIPRGSVVGLIGKNGEGKSSTMRLICGLHQPTSGTVQVLGTQLTPFTARHIQSQIALCPQENVIWPDLTCLEHLQILAKIRGVEVDQSAGTLDEYLIHLLHDVYLGTRANECAGTLSGGQKRKLCMAMALLGSPAVILLDEPTSNMDVYTRQHAWSLIQQARKHSTVIITSHSMEEIEQVSDYVALIKKGQVRVVGTPLWIKSKFCSGSRIVLLPDQSAAAPFNAGKVLSAVRDHFGAAELVAHHPTSVLIHVPVPEGEDPSVHAEKAAVFLESWDEVNQAKQLGVAGISLSLIPLEDVFIKLNDEWDQEPDEDDVSPAEETESQPQSSS